MPEITAQLSTALADRYKIESHLGAGGMATVYLAHDVKHDRKVALKVLRQELAAVIGAERFLNEIKVTANLQHPHILPLHDSGTVKDASGTFLYYVMPFVEGETLRDKLDKEKQLGIEEAVDIAKAVGSALDYAHRQGVIHRDIKPENVLIHDEQAMIADFGIALAVSQAGGSRITETGLSIGTPHYMSPEQAMGDRELDARADVYSLGAMLYEMLAGDPPYTGSTAQAIVAKVITEKAPLVTAARDTVPLHIAATIHKALEKLPADRFHSAAEFNAALGNTSLTLPATAMTAAAAPASRRPRRKVLWPTVAAILALVAAIGWFRPSGVTPPPVTRYQMVMAEVQDLITRYGNRLALSPDGRRLVYVGLGAAGGELWLRERDDLEARVLPGTEAATSPFFSPDGQSVGFVTTGAPTEIRVASLMGGPPITVADSGTGLLGGAWSRDGYIYFDGGTPGTGLMRVRATGGSPEVVSTLNTAEGEASHHWPAALPNEKGILMSVAHGTVSQLDQLDIAVLDLQTGEHQILVRGVQGRYVPTGHIIYVTFEGALMAVPFDADRLETTGPPVAMADGVSTRIDGALDLTTSETGTLMYVAGLGGEAPNDLAWVDRNGRASAVDTAWVGQFFTPRISPDQRYLAIAMVGDAARDLWIKQLDDGPEARLTFPAGQDHRPWWTPDGRYVYFVTERGDSRDLYRKRADGIGGAEVVLDLETPVNQAFLTPDGEWLVYRTGRIDNLDIYAKRLTGDTTPMPIANESTINEHTPTLSPDGRWLAYIGDESGRWELYVRPFPNVDDGRWLVSSDGASEPVWANSGREIFYKNAENELVVAEVIPSTTFVVGQKQVLFSLEGYYNYEFHPQYDISSDDQRFLMVRVRDGGVIGDLIVVDNWFTELKARAESQ